MSLLQAGVDTSVIALWLGHAGVRSTDAYVHADISIKEKALALTTPARPSPAATAPPTRSSRSSRACNYAEHGQPAVLTSKTHRPAPRHSRGVGIGRRRSPWSPPAGRYRAPRRAVLSVRTPGRCSSPRCGYGASGPSRPAGSAAPDCGPRGDAGPPGRLGEGIQRPLRRAVLPLRGQLPGPVARQPPRRHRAGQRDDGRPLGLGDPPPAPTPGRLPSPPMPAALNRCSQRRTFLGWQPSCPRSPARLARPSLARRSGRVRASSPGMPGTR